MISAERRRGAAFQSGGARAGDAPVGILIFDEEAHCISTHRFDLVADGP